VETNENENEKKDIEHAVSAVLRSDDAKALAIDYAELGIDALFAEGIARDLPLISTFVGVAKIGVTIQDRLFAKKLFKMLGPLATIDTAERVDMIDRLERDPKYGRKVGEHLVELIDRVEAYRKPPMISAVFLAYQKNEIDADMLNRLTHAVERIPVFDIDALRPLLAESKLADENEPVSSLQNLLYAGLVKISSVWDGDKYSVNEVGETFLRLNLDQIKS
jgi:hypothetical protein